MAQGIVRLGPQMYKCCVGAWEYLPEYLKLKKIKRVALLHGDASWKAAAAFFPEMGEVEVSKISFNHACTAEEVARVGALYCASGAQLLIVVGGGKMSDCGKQVAVDYNCPIVILPTLAATCAAWTPLAVMYNSAGVMTEYNIFTKQTDLVLIDPMVILDSPKTLLIAGIADTLAKWYEADVVLRKIEQKRLDLELAHDMAAKCRKLLLTYADAALKDMSDGICSATFVKVVETNIMLAGLVGGFGDEQARTTGAHALHDAMSILPQSHTTLHGLKVGYCILVQLQLEKRPEEVAELMPWYEKLQIPVTLAAIIGEKPTEEDYQQLANQACFRGSQLYLVDEHITASDVMLALQEQEQAGLIFSK